MNVILNRITVQGAKCIDKVVNFDFSKKTMAGPSYYEQCNVAAIYGPNGSGKSGIASALYLYRELLFKQNALADPFLLEFAIRTINQALGVLSLTLVFTIWPEKDGKPIRYSHSLVLERSGNEVSIAEEELARLARSAKEYESKRVLYRLERGELLEVASMNGLPLKDKPIYRKTMNLLKKNTLVCNVVNAFRAGEEMELEPPLRSGLSHLIEFGLSFEVAMERKDEHADYLREEVLAKNYAAAEDKEEWLARHFSLPSAKTVLTDLSFHAQDFVPAWRYKEYQEDVSRLCDFIRIFKPNLDRIELDVKPDGEIYRCKKIFCYGATKIDAEFESNGIQKLVRMFSVLRDCANGSIVFFDEMDANLHDVYFSKMLEFFCFEGKGQLIFTTHSLAPIDLLKNRRHALHFLSENSIVYSWKKNGNKSPLKAYVEGLIPHSAFSVDSIDYGILLEEEE